jgi:hypothetical protein
MVLHASHELRSSCPELTVAGTRSRSNRRRWTQWRALHVAVALAAVALPVLTALDARADDAPLRGVRAALADPDTEVRLSALRWLAKQAENPTVNMDVWASELAQDSSLRNLQAELLPKDGLQQTFYAELSKLPALASQLEAGLVRAALEAPLGARILAVAVIGRLERPSDATRAALVQLLEDNEVAVRDAAMDALDSLGPEYARSPDFVTALLQKESTRRYALRLLADRWPGYMTDARVLAAFLRDADPTIVSLTVRALQLHPAGVPAWSQLDPSSKPAMTAESLPLVLCGLGVFVAPPASLAQIIEGCAGGRNDYAEAMLRGVSLKSEVEAHPLPPIMQAAASGDVNVRRAAVQALLRWNDPELLETFVGRLVDPDSQVFDAALRGITSLGDEARSALPSVLEALSTRPDVEGSTFGAVLQAISPDGDALPNALGELLKVKTPRGGNQTAVDDSTVHIRARDAVLSTKELRERVAPQIVRLLRDDRATVRETAVAFADGMPLPPKQLDEVAALLDEPSPPVEVLDVIGMQRSGATRFADSVARFLSSSTTAHVCHALRALVLLGAIEKNEREIARLAREGDALVRAAALDALARAPGMLARHNAVVEAALQAPDLVAEAIASLRLDTSAGRRYSAAFVRHLNDGEHETSSVATVKAIAVLAPLDDMTILRILELAHQDNQKAPQYRFFAYLASGGRSDAIDYIGWLNGAGPSGTELPLATRRSVLRRFNELWPLAADTPNVRAQMGDLADELVQTGGFGAEDLDSLGQLQTALEEIGHPASQRLSRAALIVKAYEAAKAAAGFLILHIIAWVVLLAFYPKSKTIQAFFFWNPWARKLGGLGYVDIAASRVDLIRNRLLMPFRDRFTEDAAALPEDVGDENYFAESLVEYGSTEDGLKRTPLALAIATIRGPITLEGESGLGKSVFLRRLVRASKRPTIYLPAERCAPGVLTAIQQKLQGFARDEAFLATLIYTGGIDLCIDGLNEVTPETRAAITQFVRSNPYANVLLATQPLLDWRAPGQVYRLLALEEKKALEFLKSRYPTASAEAAMSLQAYETACDNYVSEALHSTDQTELVEAHRLVLSNPMDLTVVAQMLLARKRPDILRLQEQQFSLAAAKYRRMTLREFPLSAFSERIYQMRLRDDSELPEDLSEPEVASLAQSKMTFGRDGQDGKRRWYFRHDKVLEFFVLQTFLGGAGERAGAHLDDPRFRGVYFLMAMLLPFDAATLLRDQLVLRATKTNNHTVSDRFVQLLESRRVMRGSGPAWLDYYELPAERSARARLQELEESAQIAGEQIKRVRDEVVGWVDCRGMLVESAEERLLEKATNLMQLMGASEVTLQGGGAVCCFRAAGRSFALAAATSAQSIHVEDVLEVHHALGPILARSEELIAVLVMNVRAPIDPARRDEWLEPAALDCARERGIACITSALLLEQVARVQAGERTDEEFWSSLGLRKASPMHGESPTPSEAVTTC